jgi:hypothetical protein
VDADAPAPDDDGHGWGWPRGTAAAEQTGPGAGAGRAARGGMPLEISALLSIQDAIGGDRCSARRMRVRWKWTNGSAPIKNQSNTQQKTDEMQVQKNAAHHHQHT